MFSLSFTKMSYSLDVETFIQAIEKYPDIWNIRSEGNRYKSRKMAAWGHVARVFIADFDDLGAQDQNEIYTKLIGKWRNIRDQYVRHRRNKKSKNYMYASNLHFLDSIYNNNSSVEEQDGNETQDWSDGDEKLRRIGFVSTGPEEKSLLEVSSDWQTDDGSLVSIASRSIDLVRQENRKKRKSDNSVSIEYVDTPALLPDVSCSYAVEDEDKSFFDSLLPAVRDLDTDQKLEFRSEVLKLIRAVRSKKRIKPDPEYE